MMTQMRMARPMDSQTATRTNLARRSARQTGSLRPTAILMAMPMETPRTMAMAITRTMAKLKRTQTAIAMATPMTTRRMMAKYLVRRWARRWAIRLARRTDSQMTMARSMGRLTERHLMILMVMLTGLLMARRWTMAILMLMAIHLMYRQRTYLSAALNRPDTSLDRQCCRAMNCPMS